MNATIACLLLLVGSYLIGSISSAILVTRIWRGEDIRKIGAKNASTLNVARSLGLFPAALAGLLDFAKGMIPVVAARQLGLSDACALLGVVMAVLGHSLPLYFRLSGGKGLAVAFGGLLVFAPLETILALPFLGLFVVGIAGSMLTATLISLGLLTGLMYLRGYPLVIVLAPVTLLAAMLLGSLPQIIRGVRSRTEKSQVLADWLTYPIRRAARREVAVVTDSIASLPPEVARREKIEIVPLALSLPEGVFKDGVDIDARAFYTRIRAGELECKTSAPSPGDYLSVYESLAARYKSAVVVTPAKELTRTWESASLAKDMIAERFPVTVFDSRSAGPAQGFIALAAARLAEAGKPVAEIIEALEAIRSQVGFVGVLTTLEFLVRGGRVSEAQQWIKSALQIYPLLYISDGVIRLIGLARTKNNAVRRMKEWLQTAFSPGALSLAICHTDAFEDAQRLAEELTTIYRPEETFVTEMTPIIGAHAGPGLLGVAWWSRPGTKD